MFWGLFSNYQAPDQRVPAGGGLGFPLFVAFIILFIVFLSIVKHYT